MKKLYYTDAARILALLCVFTTHFTEELAGMTGVPALDTAAAFLNGPLGMAGVATLLFFMVSGYCMVRFAKEPFKPLLYYRKRFFRTLLPEYILILGIIVLRLLERGTLSDTLNTGTSPFQVIFTLLGMDGLLHVRGLPSFTTIYTGEWFLGILVILYLLFPLLYRVLRKHPHILMAAVTAAYLLETVFRTPGGADLLPNLFVFTAGMYLAAVGDQVKLGHCFTVYLLALVLLVTLMLDLPRLTFQLERIRLLRLTIWTAALFLLLMRSEHLLEKVFHHDFPLIYIRSLSYEFFLVHHGILTRVVRLFVGGHPDQVRFPFVVLSFVLSLLASVLAALVLRILEDPVGFIGKFRKRVAERRKIPLDN